MLLESKAGRQTNSSSYQLSVVHGECDLTGGGTFSTRLTRTSSGIMYFVCWRTLILTYRTTSDLHPLGGGSLGKGRCGSPMAVLDTFSVARLCADLYGKTGIQKRASILDRSWRKRYWDDLIHDCCGDSLLGWALWKRNVTLSGRFRCSQSTAPIRYLFRTSNGVSRS